MQATKMQYTTTSTVNQQQIDRRKGLPYSIARERIEVQVMCKTTFSIPKSPQAEGELEPEENNKEEEETTTISTEHIKDLAVIGIEGGDGCRDCAASSPFSAPSDFDEDHVDNDGEDEEDRRSGRRSRMRHNLLREVFDDAAKSLDDVDPSKVPIWWMGGGTVFGLAREFVFGPALGVASAVVPPAVGLLQPLGVDALASLAIGASFDAARFAYHHCAAAVVCSEEEEDDENDDYEGGCVCDGDNDDDDDDGNNIDDDEAWSQWHELPSADDIAAVSRDGHGNTDDGGGALALLAPSKLDRLRAKTERLRREGRDRIAKSRENLRRTTSQTTTATATATRNKASVVGVVCRDRPELDPILEPK